MVLVLNLWAVTFSRDQTALLQGLPESVRKHRYLYQESYIAVDITVMK